MHIAVVSAVVLSVVQSACRGLAASMATVVAGMLRSVTLLSFALRSFASASFRFVCWAAKAFAAGCLSVVAVVESARDLAAPMMVAVPVVSRAVVVLALVSHGFVAQSRPASPAVAPRGYSRSRLLDGRRRCRGRARLGGVDDGAR